MSGAAVLFAALALPATVQTYFPPEFRKPVAPCTTALLSDPIDQWAIDTLKEAGEPPLPPIAAARSDALKSDVLRFTWLRSFQPPVTVRIFWPRGRRARMIAWTSVPDEAASPNAKTVRRIDRTLTNREVERLRDSINAAAISKVPQDDCVFGNDGAVWLFETVQHERYRVFGRWSPRPGPLRNLGLTMLALTGWRVDDIY